MVAAINRAELRSRSPSRSLAFTRLCALWEYTLAANYAPASNRNAIAPTVGLQCRRDPVSSLNFLHQPSQSIAVGRPSELVFDQPIAKLEFGEPETSFSVRHATMAI